MSTISFNKYQFPSYEDYKGAVTAIIRLQDTYQLPAHNLTQPEMAGVQAVKMTASDCFDVGEWRVPLCNTLGLSALCLVCVGHCLFSSSLVTVVPGGGMGWGYARDALVLCTEALDQVV